MKLAVMTRSTALFQLICQCFEPDGAQCTRFSDEVVFARAIYRDPVLSRYASGPAKPIRIGWTTAS